MLQRITIHELVIAIITVFVVVVLLIIAVLLYSLYKYRILHNKQIWTTVIERKITDSIVAREEPLTADPTFAIYLRNSAFRSLFLNMLVASERKFSGTAREEVVHLFQIFQLEDEAWEKLHNKKAYIIAGGIQELAAMKVERALPIFTSLLTHPQQQVYQEAQYAIVSFKGFDGLTFLNTLTSPLSDWQQLRLLRSITNIPAAQLNHIHDWLASSNSSVVIFTLRLMRKFQLLSFYSSVFILMDHPLWSVRVQAVRTLQALENVDTVDHLMEAFPNQPQPIQLEILKALKLSKSPHSEHFLKMQLWQHPANAVKVFSAEVLVSLGRRQYLREMAMDENTPSEFKQIINHALQEKIC